MLFILLAFIIWRVFDFLTALLAPKFITYLGHFSHPKVLELSNLPKFIKSFANFDGIFYVRIASQGYEQFEQAFFPLYPLLMGLFSLPSPNSKIIVGLLVSNISFLLGLFILKKYLEIFKIRTFWPVIFLLAFPTSFFFGAVYTEGLFFLLVVLTFYSLKKESFIWATTAAAFASATRPLGVFLIIPMAIYMFKRRNQVFAILIALLSPLLGFAAYSFFLWKKFADPFMFFNSQPAFGAGRSTELILIPQVYFRYFKIFFTADNNFQYFVSILEFSIFTTVFFSLLWFIYKKWQEKDWDLISLTVFSLINLLVPTLTGTLSSIPRYILLSLSFFILLVNINKLWLKLIIALTFILLHTILLGFFIQGYFVS